MKLKFKKGDVVIVKENTTSGFCAGTVVRIESVRYDDENYKSYLVQTLDGTSKKYHDQEDLRKIKGWDK